MSWLKKDTILQTGDVLETDSSLPIVRHYGIVYYKDGKAQVTHNPGGEAKPVTESLDEFKSKREIYRIFRNKKTLKLTDEEIVRCYEEQKHFKWNFFTNNCEDYIKNIANTRLGVDNRVWMIVAVVVVVSVVIGIIMKTKK